MTGLQNMNIQSCQYDSWGQSCGREDKEQQWTWDHSKKFLKRFTRFLTWISRDFCQGNWIVLIIPASPKLKCCRCFTMSLEELQQLEEQATACVAERWKMSDFMSTFYLSLCPEWRRNFSSIHWCWSWLPLILLPTVCKLSLLFLRVIFQKRGNNFSAHHNTTKWRAKVAYFSVPLSSS